MMKHFLIVTRRAKFWIEAYGIKEARVVIHKDYRLEFATAALAPARLLGRRASVALEPIERYVIAENNVESQPEGEENMDIDNEQTDSRRNTLPNENYSVSQHENLAIFDAIPKAAETPEKFLSFHRDTRSIPKLLPLQRPADNYFASLPRMLEALPSYGTVAPNQLSRDQESSAFHMFQRASNESLPQAAFHSQALFSPLSVLEQQPAARFLPPAAGQFGLNLRSQFSTFGQQSAANFLPPAADRTDFNSRDPRSQFSTFGQQTAVDLLLPASRTPLSALQLPQRLPPAAGRVGLYSREMGSPLSALQLPERPPPAADSNLVDAQENTVPNLMTNIYGFIEYFKRAD